MGAIGLNSTLPTTLSARTVDNLFENWNRYYEPLTGRYLQPEPMMQEPKWVGAEARIGMTAATYSYARNNPLHVTDPTGLFSWARECPNNGVFERGFAIETSPLGARISPRRLRETPGSVAFHNSGVSDACVDCREARSITNQTFAFSFAKDCWDALVKDICDACEEEKNNKCEPGPQFPPEPFPWLGPPRNGNG